MMSSMKLRKDKNHNLKNLLNTQQKFIYLSIKSIKIFGKLSIKIFRLNSKKF